MKPEDVFSIICVLGFAATLLMGIIQVIQRLLDLF